MFSCQPGRQTACINLSHAKDPFKAAIICSSCLILWGQWEGLEWDSFNPRQAVEQTLELSWQIFSPIGGETFPTKIPEPPNPQISYSLKAPCDYLGSPPPPTME